MKHSLVNKKTMLETTPFHLRQGAPPSEAAVQRLFQQLVVGIAFCHRQVIFTAQKHPTVQQPAGRIVLCVLCKMS